MNERTSTAHVVNVPMAPHWNAELTATVDLSRGEFAAAVKALRKRELAAIHEKALAHINEVSGVDVCTWITSLTDAVVRCLARRAFLGSGASLRDYERWVAVCAIGGYGRGEMNPGSDLDLLVLVDDGRAPPWVAAGNQELQTLCWDVGFQVGGSMRTLGELDHIIREDFVTATAVIEGRRIDGSPTVERKLEDLLATWRRKRSKEFLKYKVGELEERRAKTGASLFLMETNLKSNPGCLRDIQLLCNIAFVLYGGRNLLALEQLEVIDRDDLAGVIEATSHLLLIRSLTHFHHGRKHDIFQLADQLRIAKQLGYADVSRLRDVEHLMRRHYDLVTKVHRTVELTLSRLRALGHLGRRPLLILSRRVLDPDFTSVEGRVYLNDKAAFWQLSDVGLRLVRLCRTAQQRDLRISFELQRLIRANLAVLSEEVHRDPRIGRLLLDILGDVGRVKPILSDLHHCGLLGILLPEFGNVTCLMQFDSYHQYTVDEHTLIAIGHLDAFAREQVPGLTAMRSVWPRLQRKDLLVLGLLLHDVGKYMGRGHVARGAMMVEPVARRLGLNAEEEDLVHFLVERHVALSDASRMRDFHEPSFLATFTDRIGTVGRLDYLYCLTWADAKAVGEGILTGWQEALLDEIRAAVRDEMTRRAGGEPVGRKQRMVSELVGAGWTPEAVERWMADLPHTWQYQVQPGEGRRHLGVLEAARNDGIGMEHEDLDTHDLLILALPDRVALFADVAATLTGHTFDIIDTRTWVTASGLVLYHFRLGSPLLGRVKDAQAWERLRTDLRKVSRGELQAGTVLARRRKAYGVATKPDSAFDDPAVKIDSRTSSQYTIVDIHAKDEAGLLSTLCQAIADYGVNITYACINTMGDVAVDVFYVDRQGAKLSDTDSDGLRRHLIATLRLTSAETAT